MKHYYVEGKTLPEAYHKALTVLKEKGEIVGCTAYDTICRECGMTMYVEEAMAEPMISRCFIGGFHELQQYLMEVRDGILDFMIGVGENVWEYTYHERVKDQIPFIIEELKRDPDSRRAIIDVRKNEVDMNNDHPACLQNMSFMIRNNKLNLIVTMRSNDAPEATFMNAFGFIVGWQKQVADALGVEVGSYTHIAYSFHAYEKNFKTLDDYIDRIERGVNCTYNYEGHYDKLMEEEIPSIERMVKDQHDKYYSDLEDKQRRKIVTLCGSFKFNNLFYDFGRLYDSYGYQVLYPEVFDGDKLTEKQRNGFDIIHQKKIDVSDTVHIMNYNDYIGEDTQNEIDYAKSIGKPVVYLFPHSED